MKTLPTGLGAHFTIEGKPAAIQPYGRGHIHNTYLLATNTGNRYILQRINRRVFPDIEALQWNLLAVTRHITEKQRLRHSEDWMRRVLRPIETTEGAWVHNSPDGAAWRAFDYISGTQTIEQVSNPEQAFALGAAIGEFQNMLSDLSTSLHETIPDFHETLKRFEAFHQALLSAPPERLQMASAEVRFAETRRELCTRLVQPQEKGLLPRRITHNDTKINNLLFDAGTGEALCVIDLDTVMPGLTLYDFGDMVRTGTPTRPEDHAETRGIRVDLDRFASLAQGYLSTAGPFLNGTERSLLVFAGRLLTYETGLRFLTDYLAGDVYFRIHYAGQNLDRARNQFRLLEDMEVKADRMEAILFAVWERLIS